MGESSDPRPDTGTFEAFAERWFTPLVSVLLLITALAEEQITLPVSARDSADALARMAPPPHVLTELRLSGLVDADPLPDHERDRHGG